jgi:AhpD family alkylhydroperoxidase
MAKLIEYADASPEARAVFEDIAATRGIAPEAVNNVWKAMAVHPENMRRFWERIKDVMGPGTLDPLTKELIYLAVSMSQQCEYCVASHTAAAKRKGADEAMLAEMIAIVGLAVEGNRMAYAYQVPVDDAFKA